MRIEIPVFDGVDELDVFGSAEPLFSAGFDVALVGIGAAGPIRTQRGILLTTEAVLARPDVVLVPGGGWLSRAPQGSWAEVRRGALPARLREIAPEVTIVASVCTGAFLLQAAGLLDARPATTNRNARDELRATGVDVLDERVVDAGPVVTAAGLSAGLDLGVHLVERLAGRQKADQVCASLEYDRQGRVHHDAG